MSQSTSSKECRQYRIDHGLCPECGEESAPYYLCTRHRSRRSLSRLLNKFADRGMVEKTYVGREARFKILPGYKAIMDQHHWPATLWDMDPDDRRLRPRMGKRPVDLDETLISIFMDAGKPLTMEEIYEAWGKLRSKRKHETLAGDMAALIQAQRKRDARNAKRAALAHPRRIPPPGSHSPDRGV